MDFLNRLFQKKTETPSNPPLGEIAFSEFFLFNNLTNFPRFNPDILVRNKGGLIVYDSMRQDDQVKNALLFKKNAVLAPGWFIEPASDEPEDMTRAALIEESLAQMSGTVNGVLKHIMLGLDYGYSINEIVWGRLEHGEFEGHVYTKAIKSRRPHNFAFKTDKFDNLEKDGLQQWIGGLIRPLPVNKFLIYTYQKEFGNWHGISDLRAAYRSFWSKDVLIKFWNIYMERHATPPILAKYKSIKTDIIARIKTMLDKLQSKSALIYDGNEVEFDLLESSKKSAAAEYEKAVDYHNRSISRALLIPDRLTSSGEKGAFAQAKVHFDSFLWIVKELRDEIAEKVMTEQLIRRTIGWNFAEPRKLPQFKFKPLTEGQKIELANVFIEAVSKGAIIPTLEDENKLRDTLDFPEVKERAEPNTGHVDKKPNKDETGEGKKQEMTKENLFLKEADPDFERRLEEFIRRTTNTPTESSVNFQQIEANLVLIEDTTLENMRALLIKQRDALTKTVTNAFKANKVTLKFIRDIELRHLRELRQMFNKMYDVSYKQGKTDGRGELPKRFKTAQPDIAVVPQDALDFFESRTDFNVKGIKEPLVRDTQGILLSAMKEGTPVSVTVKKIQDAYRPYTEDGNVIIDDKQLQGFRLEAIVRTNVNEAYNWGRRAVGEDPDLAGFVLGYQFSEILDDRTVEVSRFVDGKIISLNSPSLPALTYPLHFNERGMFIFVTKDQQPINFMSDADIATAITMKGI